MSEGKSLMPIDDGIVDDSIVSLADEGFTLLTYVVNKMNQF